MSITILFSTLTIQQETSGLNDYNSETITTIAIVNEMNNNTISLNNVTNNSTIICLSLYDRFKILFGLANFNVDHYFNCLSSSSKKVEPSYAIYICSAIIIFLNFHF